MKISVQEDNNLQETEVIIRCRETNEQVLKLLTSLRILDKKITGIKDGQTFLLNAGSILYAEAVDKKTFMYTSKEVYETNLRLYELVERLSGEDFFRASKSCVVNFSQVQSLRPEFGGRMILTMNNGERIFVSRQYTVKVKEKLQID